ncbi:MAG: phenylacetate--CoA ligase family protein [Candidatus Wildermuthbacteria bacterium]|nr:phenylacetate--CoA ligase family protein [Candidatus Wildermuthbacteria bacterium]
MLDSDIKTTLTRLKSTKIYGNLYDGIDDVHDFTQIPFLDESRIRNADFGSLKKEDKGLYVYFTSGTTSKPKAIYYNADSIEYATEYLKWFCEIEGIAEKERVVVLMDQYFWGVGYFTTQGHVRAGNTVIPIDTDLPREVIGDLIKASHPTVISSLPSVLIELKDVLRSPDVKILETTGELLAKQTRREIETYFNAEIFDAYGLTEGIIGVECRFHDGYHFLPNKAYLEIIDLETDKVLQEDKWGELAITTFSHAVTPITRYKTKDICKISQKKCPCGDKSPRVWVKGRNQETILLHEGSELAVKDLEAIISKVYGKLIKHKIDFQKEGSTTILRIWTIDTDAEKTKLMKSKIVNFNYETMHLSKRNKLRVVINGEV